MSKLFKASRIVMDNEVYILKAPVIPKRLAPEEISIRKEEDVSDGETDRILEEARMEAERLVQTANESASSLIEDAYSQSEGIFEKAKNDGYEEGYRQGYEQATATLEPLIEEVSRQKEEYMALNRTIYADNERQMIQIVLEVIDKVFDFRLENDPELVEGLIRKALRKITRTTNVQVIVSEDDYYHAVSLKDVLLLKADRVEQLEILKDPDLPRGSCVVQTEHGTVDSSLSVQLAEIKRLFEELYSHVV